MYASTSNGRWLNACARCVANVREEAAAWVARLDGQTAAPDEQARFDDWLSRSSAHAAAYEEALRTWRDLSAMRSSEQYRALLGKPTLRERLVSALRAPRWAALAATTAAIAMVVWLGVSLDAFSFLRRPTQVVTQVAEVREMTLPDGTRVVLGAQSQLSFEVTQRMRHATVVGGDAYFAVTSDSARPFRVSIGDVQVRVVGTQFEIRRRSGEVSVAVAEGTVDVSRTDAAGAAVRLRRGEALTARSGSASAVRAVEPTDIAAWRSGRLVYDNAELRDVVADANRYARSQIVIADVQLTGLRVTTSFRASQVEGMIETLQAALPLVAERQPNGDIVLRARQ
jgi:transmembrane sensor